MPPTRSNTRGSRSLSYHSPRQQYTSSRGRTAHGIKRLCTNNLRKCVLQSGAERSGARYKKSMPVTSGLRDGTRVQLIRLDCDSRLSELLLVCCLTMDGCTFPPYDRRHMPLPLRKTDIILRYICLKTPFRLPMVSFWQRERWGIASHIGIFHTGKRQACTSRNVERSGGPFKRFPDTNCAETENLL